MEEEPKTNGEEPGKDPVTGKFVAGNSMGGRTEGTKNFMTKVKEAIEVISNKQGTDAELAMAKRIVMECINGNPQFMKMYWEQSDGKPLQKTEQDIKTTVTLEEALDEIEKE